MHICMFCFMQKGEKDFVYARRGEEFGGCLSPCLCIYVCLALCTLLNILLFIAMHELRGSFYEA